MFKQKDNYYFEEIHNGYVQNTNELIYDNAKILEKSLSIFESTGCKSVKNWRDKTNIQNNEVELWNNHNEEMNRYFKYHFCEFEELLIETCYTANKLISYKPDKQKIQKIYNVLIGFRTTYYRDGLCCDLLNNLTYDYEKNNIISESQADKLESNTYQQFILMQKLLEKYCKEMIKILKNHDLPMLFRDYAYGNIIKYMKFEQKD